MRTTLILSALIGKTTLCMMLFSSNWAELPAPHCFLPPHPSVGSLPSALPDMGSVSMLHAALNHGDVATLRQWHINGQLAKLVPGWQRVSGPLNYQHIGHDYRLDEHMLHAMMYARQSPWFARLTPTQQKLVTTATLFHDIAKQTGSAQDRLAGKIRPDPHHHQAGADWAKTHLASLGFTPGEVNTIALLIQHHTDLGELSRWPEYYPQSPEVPDTEVAKVARALQTPSNLAMLMVLTEADIRAVRQPHRTLWTPKNQARLNALATRIQQQLP